MSKTAKVVCWSVTATNIAFIAWMLLSQAKAETCYPLENGRVCVIQEQSK